MLRFITGTGFTNTSNPVPVFVRCLSAKEDCRSVAVVTAKLGISACMMEANYAWASHAFAKRHFWS